MPHVCISDYLCVNLTRPTQLHPLPQTRSLSWTFSMCPSKWTSPSPPSSCPRGHLATSMSSLAGPLVVGLSNGSHCRDWRKRRWWGRCWLIYHPHSLPLHHCNMAESLHQKEDHGSCRVNPLPSFIIRFTNEALPSGLRVVTVPHHV